MAYSAVKKLDRIKKKLLSSFLDLTAEKIMLMKNIIILNVKTNPIDIKISKHYKFNLKREN